MWACPNHGMEEDSILHNFYDHLTQAAKKQLDATRKRTFSSLSLQEATTAIEEAIRIDTCSTQATIPRNATNNTTLRLFF